MFRHLFLIYLIVKQLCFLAAWCVLSFIKWFALMLLWCMSPQQAVECYDEMEAEYGKE